MWAFRLVESPNQPIPAWAKALTIVLSIRPILGDLTHGNINIFILFLVMASLYSFSRGRDRLSGVLLALAIACKVTPALFVVYFLYKRAWGVLIGCAIGLVLFFFVVPSLIFAAQSGSLAAGWERNWSALTAWIDGMIVPYLVHGMVTPEKENQSLPGVLTRLLTHSPSFSAWVDNVYVPLAYHNIANLDSATIKRIVQGCQVLFVAHHGARLPIAGTDKRNLSRRGASRLAAGGRVFDRPRGNVALQRANVEAPLRDVAVAVRGLVLCDVGVVSRSSPASRGHRRRSGRTIDVVHRLGTIRQRFTEGPGNLRCDESGRRSGRLCGRI